MKITLPTLLLSLCLPAQKISSGKWSDLFSYNNVLAMKADNNRIIAATENGIFYYTPSTGEITKLSKANGLHQVKISAFDYNPDTKIALVGYTDGTMDEVAPDGITYIVDIPMATGYTGSRSINHISINGSNAAVSVGYGVSIFHLDKKEFGDTAFFYTSGTFEAVNEAVIQGNTVYATTATGLKSHALDVSFPVYSGWVAADTGNFKQLAATGTTLLYSDGTRVKTGATTALPQTFTAVQDVVVDNQNITVTDQTGVYVYDLAGNIKKSFDAKESLNTGLYFQQNIFAGSHYYGIIDENRKSYKPDGPYTNTSYKISLLGSQILVSTGGRTNRFNDPSPDPRNLGFYYYTGTEWVYPQYFKNNATQFNVLDAVQNPSKPAEVYFANYTTGAGHGVYRMKYNAASKDFDFDKSYLFNGDYIWRAAGLAFDARGNLFGSVAYYNGTPTSALMAYDPAADKFTFLDTHVTAGTNGVGAQKPVISEGFLWLPIPRAPYLVADKYNNTLTFSDDVLYNVDKSSGFSGSTNGVISMALDANGDAWIGTDNGLRILSSAASAVQSSPTVSPIIIEQNGLGEELFRNNQILQVEVDSGNKKWVSVDGGGAYYLSPDGQSTINHFTKANSPLPNDSVTDIKFDNATGKVYFVTRDGIVVYQGDAVDVNSNFGKVLVYPNPVVYSHYKGNVTIRGLAQKTNIRITDAAGNLVHQAVATGGSYQWDLNNMRGNRVASGIYFVLMTNEDATDKATAKIAVVN